eukprot:s2644_g8.t1
MASEKEEFFLTIGPGGPAMHRLVHEELGLLSAVAVERFGQARFFFSAPLEPVQRFFSLRAPEKLYALALRCESTSLQWPPEKEAAESALAQLVAAADWPKALRVWRRFSPHREALPRSFRVTGKRAGQRGSQLSSNGIAEFVGEALTETMGWQVDLHDYDLEVVVHLNDDHLIVCLPLLERGEAQQAQFALPGLSQPVAWAMARSVEVSPGDVIVDPMCGSGIVLFEAAQCWRGACYLGFDVDASQLDALPYSEVFGGPSCLSWSPCTTPAMSSTWRQRFYMEPEENRVKKFPKKKNVHILAESPLSCIVDGDRICELAAQSGVEDIVKMYDDGSTESFPSVEELKAQVATISERCKPGHYFVLAPWLQWTLLLQMSDMMSIDVVSCASRLVLTCHPDRSQQSSSHSSS